MRKIQTLFALSALCLIAACDTVTQSQPDHRIAVLNDASGGNRLVAVPQRCPEWKQYIGDGFENHYNADFGCAQNYNLAKMIVQPKDLVVGRQPGMADADLGVLGIERYRSDKKKELINPKTINSTTGEGN